MKSRPPSLSSPLRLLFLLFTLLFFHVTPNDVRSLDSSDDDLPYEIYFNESSFIPGAKRSFGGTKLHISWFRLSNIDCPMASDPNNLYKFADTPLYALSTINNTVTLVGMLSFRSVATDYYLNSSMKVIEPMIITSPNVGTTWTCTVVNSTETITTNDIFRIGAAVTSYIYPPPPVTMNIPQVQLLTPTLTIDNVPLQCNLLCIMGGLQGNQGAYDTYYSNKVTCSKDNGITWYFGAALPTTMVRASAIQFKEELLIIGGQRGDSSAHILAAIFDYATCNITGWSEYAPASPLTDRFDLSVNTIWNNQSQTLELWAGGGKSIVGGSPLRSLDLWHSSTPSDRSSWIRVDGMLPVSIANAPADEGWSDFTAMTTRNGIPWGYQHGVCDPSTPVPDDPKKQCYDSLFLLNSDLSYIFLRDITNGWAGFSNNYLYTSGGITISSPPTHRRSVFLYDDDHDGAPTALTFDIISGNVWRVDTTPCADVCPGGYWTHSCRNSPYDAKCRPCSRCRQGFFTSVRCGDIYDTKCQKCSTCEPGQIVLKPCNPTNDTVCGYEIEYYLDSNTLIASKGKLNYVYYAILSCFVLFMGSLTLSPILLKGKNWDNGHNDSFTLISNGSDKISTSIANSVTVPPVTLRGYLSSMLSHVRVLWPLIGTLIHYVCYSTLTLALWSAPRLYIITSLLMICLVGGPLLNSVCLYYTIKGRIIVNGLPVLAWQPSSLRSHLAVGLSILHPRVLLSLLPGSSILNRSTALHSDKLPYQRYKHSLYWIMLSSMLQDVPPAMGCLLMLGAVSLPSAAPAILLCVSLGIINLFVTFAWTMSAYIRSGMLSKFSSNDSFDHQQHNNHPESIGEIVKIDDTNIVEHMNMTSNQLNPISIVSHHAPFTHSDLGPSSPRDSLGNGSNNNGRRVSKATYSMVTGLPNPNSMVVSSANLSPSSSTSSLTATLEKQASLVESLRHKLAMNQPITEQETARAAVLLTGLQGKASELLNILATVVHQNEKDNADDTLPVTDNTLPPISSAGPVVRSNPMVTINTVNNRSTGSSTSTANPVPSSVPPTRRTNGPNPSSSSSSSLPSPPPPVSTNSLGNFFSGFGTTLTNEQPYLDRVITELTAPVEIDDTLPVARTPSSASSSLVNHPVNHDDNQASEGIRSRSTSVSVTSEVGNVPLPSNTPVPVPTLSPNGMPYPLHSRISRVVRSLTPGNSTTNSASLRSV